MSGAFFFNFFPDIIYYDILVNYFTCSLNHILFAENDILAIFSNKVQLWSKAFFF